LSTDDNIMEAEISGMKLEPYKLTTMLSSEMEGLQKLSQSTNKAVERANSARDSADLARSKSTGFLKKAEAIEALQDSGKDLADALISTTDALKVLFENQSQLAEISKNLFALGVSSLAANRTVVQQLRRYLEGASEEELSELQKMEVMRVIDQLNAQADIQLKLDSLKKEAKEYTMILKDLSGDSERLGEKLAIQEEDNQAQDERLGRLEAEGQAQSARIADNIELLLNYGAKLSENSGLIAENSAVIANQGQMIVEGEEKLAAHTEIINDHTYVLDKLKSSLKRHQEQLCTTKDTLAECCRRQDKFAEQLVAFQQEIERGFAENEETHTDFASQLKIIRLNLEENRRCMTRDYQDLCASLQDAADINAQLSEETKKSCKMDLNAVIDKYKRNFIAVCIILGATSLLSIITLILALMG